jgi:hypothetical protein
MFGMEIVSHRQTWNKLVFVTTIDTKGKASSFLPGSVPMDMFGPTGNKVFVAWGACFSYDLYLTFFSCYWHSESSFPCSSTNHF